MTARRAQSRPGGSQLLLWTLIGVGAYLGLLGAGVIGIVVFRFAVLAVYLLWGNG